MEIGAPVAAWNDIEPFDSRTTRLVSDPMSILFDPVANDESFGPDGFEAAPARLKRGLLCR